MSQELWSERKWKAGFDAWIKDTDQKNSDTIDSLKIINMISQQLKN
jgi:hypothetical protein